MRFSILIPIIKGKFLPIAIESILKQSFSDWELILYNDCSWDDIEKITDKYRSNKVKYFKGKKNLGAKDPSRTWNKILTLAKGDYVCLLGDDDFLSENYLEEVGKLVLRYPEIVLFRTRLKRVNEKNEIIFTGSTLPEHETWDQMMYQRNKKNRVQSTCEFILKRDKLLEVGGYPSFPRACGSDDAVCLLMAEKDGIVSTNKTFGFWRKSSLNISDNDSEKINKQKMKFYLKWEKDFLDRILSFKIPAHLLYESIEKKLNNDI
ncbi:MAG: glycosyltransferase [Candidatus Taylorbacteria bacterium]|nr:glycosyltransferase [Candidatus Taylorbacteria bacterium]